MKEYTIWKDKTRYTKEIVVNCRHPQCSDSNPGTADLPLQTINTAAKIVKPTEKVVICSGIYRESFRPVNSGSGPEGMISYEAAPGERVVVKGSNIFSVKWKQKMVLTDELPDDSNIFTWSRKIWYCEIPDSFFDPQYNPFKLKNVEAIEHEDMPWARQIKDKAPLKLTRGLIFQNGKRLTPLANNDDLRLVEGSFFIDHDTNILYMHPYDNKDPNTDLFEVGTKENIVKPMQIGLSYIKIQGLCFEHCANSLVRTGSGAVTALGGHHWIIENNTIRQNNGSGLEFGYFAFEEKSPDPLNIQPRTDENPGGMIIRGNEVYQCGTAGMRSFIVHEGFVIGNHIHHCGWQDAENHWECGGIKILLARHTLVKNNVIHDIQGANGLWLDFDNKKSRATGNIIYNIQTIQGGIYVEASIEENLVDNNIIFNIDGNGIYLNDSKNQHVYHNLVANVTGHVVHGMKASDRSIDGVFFTSEGNSVKNNIFVNGGKSVFLDPAKNTSDNNVFVCSKEPDTIDLPAVKKSGFEKKSQSLRGHFVINEDIPYLYLSSKSTIEPVPKIALVTSDYHDRNHEGNTVVPGPFVDINEKEFFTLLE